MIRRLDDLTNLAIVGMSAVVPGGGDINEFGRRVYRGLPVMGGPDEKPSIESAAAQAVRQACGERGVGIGQVPIISLSARLTKILQENSTSYRIEDVSGVTPALNAAADWLESGDEDAILLIEEREEAALVCAVLVMKHKSAIDNRISIRNPFSRFWGIGSGIKIKIIYHIIKSLNFLNWKNKNSLG